MTVPSEGRSSNGSSSADARLRRLVRRLLEMTVGEFEALDRRAPSPIDAFGRIVSRPSRFDEVDAALQFLGWRSSQPLDADLVTVLEEVETRPSDLVLAWAARHTRLEFATDLTMAELRRICLEATVTMKSWDVLPDRDDEDAMVVHWSDDAFIAIHGGCTCGGAGLCGRPAEHDLGSYLEVSTHVAPNRSARSFWLVSWLERAASGGRRHCCQSGSGTSPVASSPLGRATWRSGTSPFSPAASAMIPMNSH